MHQLDMGFAGTAGTATRARAKAREADWRRQLARAYVYAAGRSPDQAEELLAEYEAREREGPDFMRIRPDSVIADAPVVTLDRNERIRLTWKFRMLTRRGAALTLKMRPTTRPPASTSRSSSFHSPDGREADARLRIR
jgi:hypothetical protein